MAGDLGACQLLFVGKERASSLSENRRTSTHKRAKILKEREKKGEIEEGGEDQEDVIPISLRARERCTSSTLGPPLMDGGMLGDRAR